MNGLTRYGDAPGAWPRLCEAGVAGLLVLGAFGVGCGDEEPQDITAMPIAATVQTLEVVEVATGSVRVRGEMTDLGTWQVTGHGFCVGIAPGPMLEGGAQCVDLGALEAPSAFEATVDGLMPGASYVVRAFVASGQAAAYGEDRTFETLHDVLAPPGLQASVGTSPEHVALRWLPVEGAASYRLFRDGELIAETDATEYTDTEAAAGAAPQAVTGLAASAGTFVDRVALTWNAALVEPGARHTYTLVAVNPSGESEASLEAVGYRAPFAVTGYQVAIGDGDGWIDVAGTGYDDLLAPAGAVTTGLLDASVGLYPDHVALRFDGAQPVDGAPVTYRVRAVSAAGAGEASAPVEGYRGVGELRYQWERSASGDEGTFAPLEGADGLAFEDAEAPADGTPAYYRVAVSADGLEPVHTEVVSGYRAVAAEVETLAASDVSSVRATLHGALVSLGVSNVVSHGFCVSTAEAPGHDNDARCVEPGTPAAEGAFEVEIDGLEPGTHHHVRAFATNSAGTVYGQGVTFLTLPAAPDAFAARPTGPDTIELTWGLPAHGIDSYVVERQGQDDDEFVVVDTVDGDVSSFTDGNLDYLTTYRYRVTAVGPAGAGEPSPVAAAKTHTRVLDKVVALSTVGEFQGLEGLAVRPDGTVARWGQDLTGEPMPPDWTDVVKVVAGDTHHYAIKADGTVVDWGRASDTARRVPEGLTDVVDLQMMGAFAVALTAAGELVTWGPAHYPAPPIPDDLEPLRTFSVSDFHGVGVTLDGRVVSWGMMHGTMPDGLDDIVAVAAGGAMSAALRADGTVAVWGSEYHGGGRAPEGVTDVVAIAASTYHVFALRADGTVVVVGPEFMFAHDVPELEDIVSLTAGASQVAAVDKHGRIKTWGLFAPRPEPLAPVRTVAMSPTSTLVVHQDGTLSGWGQRIPEHTSTPAGNDFVAAAITSGAAAALRTDGTLAMWGMYGGDPNSDARQWDDVVDVVANDGQFLALRADGTVMSWSGDTATTLTDGAIAIAAGGYNHSAAIKTDGTLVTSVRVPAGLPPLVDIAFSPRYAAAITTEGRVHVWTINGPHFDEYELALDDVVEVALTADTVVIRQADGTVSEWFSSDNVVRPAPDEAQGAVGLAANFDGRVAVMADGTTFHWGGDSSWFVGPAGIVVRTP